MARILIADILVFWSSIRPPSPLAENVDKEEAEQVPEVENRRIVKLQCDLAESENKDTGQLRLQILLRFEVKIE